MTKYRRGTANLLAVILLTIVLTAFIQGCTEDDDYSETIGSKTAVSIGESMDAGTRNNAKCAVGDERIRDNNLVVDDDDDGGCETDPYTGICSDSSPLFCWKNGFVGECYDVYIVTIEPAGCECLPFGTVQSGSVSELKSGDIIYK